MARRGRKIGAGRIRSLLRRPDPLRAQAERAGTLRAVRLFSPLVPLAILVGLAVPVSAQQVVVNEGEAPMARPLILPYAFHTEQMKLTVGGFFGSFGGI